MSSQKLIAINLSAAANEQHTFGHGRGVVDAPRDLIMASACQRNAIHDDGDYSPRRLR
jgi:hypothetical protein